MMLVDANILIYAHDSQAPRHAVAREWLEAAFSDSETIGLTWTCVLAFVRITTSPRLLASPFTLEECCAIVDGWLDQPSVDLVQPTERHWSVLREQLVRAQAKGPLAMDAELAALALEHGATLVTADKDFTRFQGLKTFNPLEAEG